MLKRFIKYYKPHRSLFAITLAAAILGAVLTVFIPAITRRLLDESIPNEDVAGITRNLLFILLLVLLTTILSYIRVK